MARIEYIRLSLHRPHPNGTSLPLVTPVISDCMEVIENVPQAYWIDGTPWHEANLWFLHRGRAVHLHMNAIATLHACATSLKLYMAYLEREKANWWHFPKQWNENILLRYRGYLIGLRQSGELASSTTKRRMADILVFYKWILEKRLLDPEFAPFEERSVYKRVDLFAGFKKTLTIKVNSLSIPDVRNSNGLEDGLLPVAKSVKDRILFVAKSHASVELHMMLLIAFSTGMRLGSICDLKEKTIDNALNTCDRRDLFAYLHLGPNVKGAAVKTKFDKEGSVIIPMEVLFAIKSYMSSVRRLERKMKSDDSVKELIFLNRFGRPYVRGGKDKSSVINVEIMRLKKSARSLGTNFDDFKFHRARATFASEVAATGITIYGPQKMPMIIGLVRKLLMHKDEQTSLAYVNFVLEEGILKNWANAFFEKHMLAG
ncbi:site-specific integrase [Pseudomonas sp. SED1]|uniref:site-specific integrase n=1 Tax=Pseudomonas sp. SED1 TaxID=3056845 RepID=UPI00296F32BA|nr:site-specific integrase [Pseudomonas sp. SED1]MDY0834191.1 site-specific integrase [Pseudomonas sp. SED1]